MNLETIKEQAGYLEIDFKNLPKLEEIKKKYLKLVKKYHPDKHPSSQANYYTEKTKKLNSAFEFFEKNYKEIKKYLSEYERTKKQKAFFSNINFEKPNRDEFKKLLALFAAIYEVDLNGKIPSINKIYKIYTKKVAEIKISFSIEVCSEKIFLLELAYKFAVHNHSNIVAYVEAEKKKLEEEKIEREKRIKEDEFDKINKAREKIQESEKKEREEQEKLLQKQQAESAEKKEKERIERKKRWKKRIEPIRKKYKVILSTKIFLLTKIFLSKIKEFIKKNSKIILSISSIILIIFHFYSNRRTESFVNDTKIVGQYQNFKKQGEWQFFRRDTLYKTEFYSAGVLKNEKFYKENGGYVNKIYKENKLIEKEEEDFYENGKLKRYSLNKFSDKNELILQEEKDFYENGNLKRYFFNKSGEILWYPREKKYLENGFMYYKREGETITKFIPFKDSENMEIEKEISEKPSYDYYGKKYFQYTYYYKGNHIKEEGNFVADEYTEDENKKIQNSWRYYKYDESGTLKERGEYEDGYKSGEFLYSYESPKAFKEVTTWYKDKKNGLYKYYDEKDKIKIEGYYEDDKKEGEWTFYDKNLKIIFSEDDEIIYSFYDEYSNYDKYSKKEEGIFGKNGILKEQSFFDNGNKIAVVLWKDDRGKYSEQFNHTTYLTATINKNGEIINSELRNLDFLQKFVLPTIKKRKFEYFEKIINGEKNIANESEDKIEDNIVDETQNKPVIEDNTANDSKPNGKTKSEMSNTKEKAKQIKKKSKNEIIDYGNNREEYNEVTGFFTMFYPNGDTEDYKKRNNVREGKAIYFYSNGDIEQYFYVNGKKEGEAYYRHLNGLKEFFIYKNGVKQ